MSIPAPPARLVNAFDGKKAPQKYFEALSEADNLCAELDTVRELQTRLAEVEAERDDLAERLLALDDAHTVTLGELARARAERDTARAAVPR